MTDARVQKVYVELGLFEKFSGARLVRSLSDAREATSELLQLAPAFLGG